MAEAQARICPTCYDDHEETRGCRVADLMMAIEMRDSQLRTQSTRIEELERAEEVLKAMHALASEGGWRWAVEDMASKHYPGAVGDDWPEQTEAGWNRAFLEALAVHEGYANYDEKVAARLNAPPERNEEKQDEEVP